MIIAKTTSTTMTTGDVSKAMEAVNPISIKQIAVRLVKKAMK